MADAHLAVQASRALHMGRSAPQEEVDRIPHHRRCLPAGGDHPERCALCARPVCRCSGYAAQPIAMSLTLCVLPSQTLLMISCCAG